MNFEVKIPIEIVNKNINKAIDSVYKAIDKSTDNLAELVAAELALTIIEILEQSIAAYNQKYPSTPTGNLSNAIMLETLGKLNKSVSYSRVIIDEQSAPYAMWVDKGRDAPYGLPYSKVGTKDYSKSRFTGHKFIEQAVSAVLTSENLQNNLANQIYKNLQTIGGK